MVGLIPFVFNDYLLTVLYLVIIAVSFMLRRDRNDFLVLILGFVVMVVSEFLFVNTGVETFNRNTLFGLMPLWLPFLWSYGFVAIKRSVQVLDR